MVEVVSKIQILQKEMPKILLKEVGNDTSSTTPTNPEDVESNEYQKAVRLFKTSMSLSWF